MEWEVKGGRGVSGWSSVPGPGLGVPSGCLLLTGRDEAWAWGASYTAHYYSPEGCEYFIVISITFRALIMSQLRSKSLTRMTSIYAHKDAVEQGHDAHFPEEETEAQRG